MRMVLERRKVNIRDKPITNWGEGGFKNSAWLLIETGERAELYTSVVRRQKGQRRCPPRRSGPACHGMGGFPSAG